MNVDKNLIEIVKIDGSNVAIERHGNNCWVSLTDLARKNGKQVNDWLRLKSTQEYLEVAKKMINRNGDSRIEDIQSKTGIPVLVEPVVVRHGGAPGEHGTWCTDYRVANRFAQWLSPEYAWFVDDAIVRFLKGESLVSDDDFFSLGGKQWVSCEKYCSILKKTPHSFYGLIGHYKKDFAWWDGQWYMSRELFSMKDIQSKFENHRLDIKSKYDEHQLSLPFTEVNMEG